ncbi:MAG: hypothetical protein GTO14_16600 [Anaerolineales bacterium]|nr:hypothetical protein [Anaerolineales bacterium]
MTRCLNANGSSIGKVAILLLLAAVAIGGCELDRSGLAAEAVAETGFEVVPPIICPGESVTVSWDVPVHDGCGRGSACSIVTSLISSPVNLIAPAVSGSEVSGSRVVTPPDDLNFRLEAIVCDERGCLSDPTIKTANVNVLHEEEGVLSAVFDGICFGARAGHRPFQLTLSPCTQVERICNMSSEAIHLETREFGRFDMRADLLPGDCTMAFNEIPYPGTPLYARPLFGIDPGIYCGAEETSGPPRNLVVDIYIGCNLERRSCGLGTASEAVVSSTCGDDICDLATEDFTSCPMDCGGGGEGAMTPDDTPEATSLPPTPPVTPMVLAPLAINFNADSYAIKAGECTTLRWQVENAIGVSLEGQEVKSLDARQVCPPSTTTYTLVATSVGEEGEARVTIEVEPLQPPAAPGQLAITNQVCNAQEYQVTMGWVDVANEDGYRVFRDGQLLATLGKNATSYTDDPPGSGPYTYSVEAFNTAGASERPSVQEGGCLY